MERSVDDKHDVWHLQCDGVGMEDVELHGKTGVREGRFASQ